METYIEPFSGAASLLINKAPHKREIYHDDSIALCKLFELLSSEDTGKKLIDYLYEYTEYSEECFNEMKDFRNRYEDNYYLELERQMKELVGSAEKKGIPVKRKEFDSMLKHIATYKISPSLLKYFLNDEMEINKSAGKIEAYINPYRTDEILIDDKPYVVKTNKIKNSKVACNRTNFKDIFCKSGKYMSGLSEQEINKIEECSRYLQQIQECYNRAYHEWQEDGRPEKFIKDVLYNLGWENSSSNISKLYIEKNKEVGIQLNKMRNSWVNRDRLVSFTENHRMECDDEYKLAASAFVIYSQSMNGLGVKFRGYKYLSEMDYKKRIAGLYEIMERLEGIEVWQGDATIFFDRTVSKFINDPSVLMYCDPTYLKEDEGSSNEEIITGSLKKTPAATDNGTGNTGTTKLHELIIKLIDTLPKKWGENQKAFSEFVEQKLCRILREVMKEVDEISDKGEEKDSEKAKAVNLIKKAVKEVLEYKGKEPDNLCSMINNVIEEYSGSETQKNEYIKETVQELLEEFTGNSGVIKEAVDTVVRKRQEYNPGKGYKMYWTRENHEEFLRNIQTAKCKLIVSNYRDKDRLYDQYLNEDYGWKSIEVPTKTMVGGKASERTEVIWYNF